MGSVEIGTIGFTQKTAKKFFELLSDFGARTLIDTRLRRKSQLAGFAKYPDLEYFVQTLCAAEYVHEPLLAPTAELLDSYRHEEVAWDEYEQRYLALLDERKVQTRLDRTRFADRAVLLCTEATSKYCHRRLAVQYLSESWGPISRIDL